MTHQSFILPGLRVYQLGFAQSSAESLFQAIVMRQLLSLCIIELVLFHMSCILFLIPAGWPEHILLKVTAELQERTWPTVQGILKPLLTLWLFTFHYLKQNTWLSLKSRRTKIHSAFGKTTRKLWKRAWIYNNAIYQHSIGGCWLNIYLNSAIILKTSLLDHKDTDIMNKFIKIYRYSLKTPWNFKVKPL